MAEVVLLEVTDRVATVTLNRPDARNAMSAELIALLGSLVAEADARDDVDVLVLTGADPAFCAGLRPEGARPRRRRPQTRTRLR